MANSLFLKSNPSKWILMGIFLLFSTISFGNNFFEKNYSDFKIDIQEKLVNTNAAVVIMGVSGTVFLDFNGNGIQESNATEFEVGFEGVTVTGYGADGTVYGPVTTASDGTYTLAAVNQPTRVEFTWSQTWLKPSAAASGQTTVQFVDASGGAITGINLGVHSPDNHWDNVNQSNPTFLIPCYADGNAVIGPNIADVAVVTFTNNDTGLSFAKGTVATHQEVGALWGVGYQKSLQRYFGSAFLKRHVGLGPEGAGGVYIFEDAGAGFDLTASFNLQGVVPSNTATAIDLGSVTRVDSPDGNNNYLGSSGLSRDMDAYGKIGKVGFGNIEINEAGDKLFMVNLNQRTLLVMDVSGNTATLDAATPATLGGLIEAYDISTLLGLPTCINGQFRPFALSFFQGKGFLGIVCDGESDNKFNNSNVEAYVLSFDPNNIAAGFVQEVQFDNFNYLSGGKKLHLPILGMFTLSDFQCFLRKC